MRRPVSLGARLHGFGVGAAGLSLYGRHPLSSDSDAWSYGGRPDGPRPHGVVKWEANCPVCARTWWENVLTDERG